MVIKLKNSLQKNQSMYVCKCFIEKIDIIHLTKSFVNDCCEYKM